MITALLFENEENPIDNYKQLIGCIVYNILYKIKGGHVFMKMVDKIIKRNVALVMATLVCSGSFFNVSYALEEAAEKVLDIAISN